MRSDALTSDDPVLASRVHFVIGFLKSYVRNESLWRHQFDDITSVAILASLETIRGGQCRLNACRLARRMIRRELSWQRRKVDPVELRSFLRDSRRHDVIPDRYFAKCNDARANVLRMTFEDDMTRDEIMSLTGMSRKAVESLFRRAKESVRKAIA